MIQKVFIVSIVLMFATNVYLFKHTWLPLPVLFSFLLIVLLFLSSKRVIFFDTFKNFEIIYFLFTFLLIAPLLFNDSITAYNISHVMSYLLPFFIFYKLYFFLFKRYLISLNNILTYISYGILLASFIAIAEFIYSLMYVSELMDLIPFTNTNQGTYMNFFRSQSLTYEPNHFGLYLVIFIPLIYLLRMNNPGFNKNKFYLFSSITFIGLLTTFSASVFVILVLDLVIISCYIFLNLVQNKSKFLLAKFIAFACIFLILVSFFKDLLIFETVLSKVSFNHDVGITGSRVQRWQYLFNSLDGSILFGTGAGQYIIELGQSAVNLWLQLLLEVGILGLLVFLTFITYPIFQFYSRFGVNKYTLSIYISFFNIIVYHISIGNYWYPWLWIFLAIVVYINTFPRNFFKQQVD
jgi:hypothetical protein